MTDPEQSLETQDVRWVRFAPDNADRSKALDILPAIYGDDSACLHYTTPPLWAPSEILRNDLIFHSTGEVERHWADRTYIALGDGPGNLSCQGFIHARSEAMLGELAPRHHDDEEGHPVPPLIEAYLACPPSIRPHAGMGHVIEDDLTSYLFGDPYAVNIRVTPYCQPHAIFSGYCAQAAVHMCLVMCSKRWGGAALGTFDIHRLANAGAGDFRLRSFRVRGLSTFQIGSVFSSPWARLDGIVMIRRMATGYVGRPLRPSDPPLYSPGAVSAELFGLVDSECPLVIAVDYNMWVLAARGQAPKGESGAKHGIVLVGYRLEKSGCVNLILHDSASRPYVTAQLDAVLDAAEGYDDEVHPDHTRSIQCVAAVPKDVSLAPIGAGAIASEFLGGSRSNRYFESLRYKLTPLPLLGAELAQLMGGAAKNITSAAREIELALRDDGVSYLWRVTRVSRSPRKGVSTVFVDAAARSDDYGRLVRLRPIPLAPCHMVLVNPDRGIKMLVPDDKGDDNWLIDR